jgi:hypothetical protein
MKSAITPNYVFTPSTKTLDLSSIVGFDIRLLYAVINSTSATLIYAQGITGLGYTNCANGIITLAYNTTIMNSTDDLMIIYEAPNTGATLILQQEQISQQTLSATSLGTTADVVWDGVQSNASIISLLKMVAINTMP